MPRSRALLVPVVGLLLAGCLRLEAPAAQERAGTTDAPLVVVTPAGGETTTLAPECPPPDPSDPSGAADWNAAFDGVDLRYWQSADLGASAMLADGRVVWVYGDTIRAGDVQPRMVDNSILVSSGTCLAQLLPEDRGPILPKDPLGFTIWPMSVLRLEPAAGDDDDVTDVVVVFCSRVQRGDRMWDFVVRGTTVAVYTVGGDGVPRLTEVAQLTPDTPDLSAIHWGAASVLDGDWVYLYGTRHTGEAYVYGHELFVSRLPAGEVLDGAALRYWDGTDWQPDPARAAPVLEALDGVSQTLSVDRLDDGRWMAFSKLGGDINDTAAVWTSDRPTGPFTVRPVLDSPGGLDTGRLQYTPLAHPQIPTASGAMLVSVSRNVTDYALLLRQPQLGRPVFAEIPRD